ncbi:hypothetical protein POM88_012080 [Heracleum sosnowskyi]|uniref:Replication protein n=1 Tax=Heracleum sosnowskyi TaxID=360622 RepID=A0AAD8IVR6_9APIA|nr:hypothetical protein POM88_012080 [Heracleum sosnowskyi]
MASKSYDTFKYLRSGKYDWKVQARVLNLWRGYTKKENLSNPSIYYYWIVSVAEYMHLFLDIQIIFSRETKISDLEESDVFIEKVAFDFYDLGDLEELSKQTTYLIDVVGVIEEAELNLAKFKNRLGEPQTQIKFHICDGNSRVKVTFWDAFAELFHEAIEEGFEWPLIVIIGSGRVTLWKEEVDISNVGATTFYINYNHYSVNHLRNMLKEKNFIEEQNTILKKEPVPLLNIKEIKELPEEYLEKQVLCNVKVKKVNTQQNWFKHICTSCYEEAKKVNGKFNCICGPRDVPYPEKWFNLCVVCCDSTGEIEIVLENVAGQKCYGKHVCDILDEDDESNFPKSLNTIEDEDYKFQIAIQNGKGPMESKKFVAKDIVSEKYPNNNDDNQPRPLEESYAEHSTSTFHLDTLSEIN